MNKKEIRLRFCYFCVKMYLTKNGKGTDMLKTKTGKILFFAAIGTVLLLALLTACFFLVIRPRRDGVLYRYTRDGYVACDYRGENEELIFPEKINNKPITGIENGVFEGDSTLASVTLPASLVRVGDRAFAYCESLASVQFPASLESIGKSAFFECVALSSVTLGDSVKTIGKYAFFGCSSLGELTLNEGVEQIDEYAFFGCSSLAEVVVPNSVVRLGGGVFSSCAKLSTLTIPFVGERQSETEYTYLGYLFGASDVRENGNFLPLSLRNVTVTNTSVIGTSAFLDCKNLSSITLPDSLVEIRDSAFSGCTSLETIELRESLLSIGESAFFGCTKLSAIAIPSGVTRIERATFKGCTSLAEVTLPDNVTSIGYSAFEDCAALSSIVLPADLEIIDSCAFQDCTTLTSLYIPASVNRIGTFAFLNCNWLWSVSFGNKEGWRLSGSEDLLSLETPRSNARMLRNSYNSYTWKRG